MDELDGWMDRGSDGDDCVDSLCIYHYFDLPVCLIYVCMYVCMYLCIYRPCEDNMKEKFLD